MHFIIVKDGSQYSALCYEYNIATCAKTSKEAFENLLDATIVYLESFLEEGRMPPQRPASRELLLEFFDLDPQKESYSREEVSKACEQVIAGYLEAPLICPIEGHEFDRSSVTMPRTIGVGTYPVSFRYV